MKKCTKCGEEKPATTEFFYKHKGGKYGLRGQCKDCRKKYESKYKAKPEVRLRNTETRRAWRKANPERSKAIEKTFREKNPNYHAEWQRKRYKNDTDWRLSMTMRNRFWRWLTASGVEKECSVFDLTGCTLAELWSHLESKFDDGMTRDNYGEWHVDHIIPLSAFNPNCWMQMSIAWDIDNLQPLWAEDNLRKGAKII